MMFFLKNRGFSLLFVLILLFSEFSAFKSIGQTDTEFWFVVPEVTWGHNNATYDPAGGVPAYLRLSSMAYATTVTISMPANPYNPATGTGFQDIVVNLLPNSTQSVNLSAFIRKVPAVAGEAGEANKLENKPYTNSGINQLGLQILATNPITAYYEDANYTNNDIWALKGRNALGTDFWVPFQTMTNNDLGYNPDPYSAIDIVATEDNTVVTIVPSKNASYGKLFTNVNAGVPFMVTLNKGETFSIFPRATAGVISGAGADHLAGTHITSNNPIAVSIKDDSIYHTTSTCRDINGDQLIPTNIIGWDYIAIRSQLTTNDHIYILATVNGTNVEVRYGATILNYALNAGQQQYVPFPSTANSMRVRSDVTHPIYVYHLGGFGCEQGGAILPPVNVCTGSTQVAFTRSGTQSFYINLMVRDGAQGSFKLDGSAAAAAALFPATSFAAVPGPVTAWKAARFGPFNTTQISVTQHLLENTEDLFHLGIVYGGSSTGCMYGYFSDFNELKVGAVVAGTNSSVLKTCYGNSVQLRATGGNIFSWTPTDYLSDPTIADPWANPVANTSYQVVVSGACEMKDTATIDVLVSTPLEALFTTDIVEGCAPLTITFNDKSTGIAQWQYDFGDGSAYQKYDNNAGTPTIPSPPNPFTFTHTFQNNTNAPIIDTITLLAKNADYCSAVYKKIIVIYPSISASYSQTLAPTNCNAHTVTFQNTSSTNTADNYLWEFGDGFNKASTDPTENFTHTFNNSHPHDTIYSMRMIATSPYECKDTATSSVTVNPYFSANYALASVAGCSPFTINVTNNSVGDTATYFWRLFDGTITTTIRTVGGTNFSYLLPVNTSNVDKVYTLTLDLRNSTACQQTVVKTITVYPQVSSSFTVPAPGKYCAGSSVALTSTSTGPITTYSWTFGDGGNSALQNPTYTFNNATYSKVSRTIQLTVTSQRGCTSTSSQNIEVYSYLKADFAVTPIKGCSPITATFTNNSRGSNTNTYLWSFGDATTSPLNTPAPHPYNNNGLVDSIRYKVKLTYTNEGSCIDTLSRYVTVYPYVTAGFTMAYDNALGCNPLTVTFTNTSRANAVYHSWSFGDDGTSGVQNPVHTFNNLTGADKTFNVTLTETTNKGCTATATANVTVMPFIDAALAIDSSKGCSPLVLDFNYTEYPGITSYRFDFDGNGTTDETRTNADANLTTRTYNNQTGGILSYNSRLTVFNHAGCSDFMENFVEVYPEVTADFTPSNVADCNPLPVAFTNNSIFTGTAAFPGNTTFYWDYGDGGSATDINPNHTFNNNSTTTDATYTIQLTATTEYGCADTYSENIQVWSRLESNFTFDQSSNCSPFNVTFYPAAQGATLYKWDYGGAIPNESFPNGNTFTRAFANADPNNLATYTITLEVQNAHGCPTSFSRDLDVYPLVVADLVTNPLTAEGCSDLSITFGNNSTGGSLIYTWDFGDGESFTTGATTNFDHLFVNRSSGDVTYNVELSAINPNGCVSQATIPVVVHPKVEANFTFVQDSTCTPFRIEVTNSSLNGTNFDWDFGHTIGGINRDTSTVKATTSFRYTIDNEDPENIQTYTISMHAETVHGIYTCQDDITRDIVVYPRVLVKMVPDVPIACSDHTVIFDNQSTGGVLDFSWNFDDGETATSANRDAITHTFINRSPANEINSVLVTATNANGCFDSERHNITTYPKVEANFVFESDSVCTPFGVHFTNGSLNGNEFRWDFGYGGLADTITYNKNLFTKIFDNSFADNVNYYNIQLISLDNVTACSDTITRSIEVFPRVITDIVPDVFTACADNTVNFTNNSTGGTLTYIWDFDDGSTATTYNKNAVTHIFTNRGSSDSTRSVLITATNANGCFNSQLHDITTHPKVEAQFTFNLDDVCAYPMPATFTNGSLNGSEFLWNFDYLNVSASEPASRTETTKTPFTVQFGNDNFDLPTTYTVQLISRTVHTATSGLTCKDSITHTLTVQPQVISIPAIAATSSSSVCAPDDITFTNSSTGGALSFLWDFGDGNQQGISTEGNVTHTYENRTAAPITRTVTLTATNNLGCSNLTAASIPVTIYPDVDAIQSYEVDYVCDPVQQTEVTLTNTSFNGSVFTWTFTPDNAGGTAQTITPGSAGYPTIILANNNDNTNVTYSVGFDARTTWNAGLLNEITCADNIPGDPIVVVPSLSPNFIVAAPQAVCSGGIITFDDNNTRGGNMTLVWNFGDGQSGTSTQGMDVMHTYSNYTSGDLTPTATVTATQAITGCVKTWSQPVRVHPYVKADFAFEVPDYCVYPLKVDFTNASTMGNTIAGVTTNYAWDYGYDWASVHQSENRTTKAAHSYNFFNPDADANATYTITLTSSQLYAISNLTCQDDTSRTLTVLPELIPGISIPAGAEYGCSDYTLTFTNTSTGGSMLSLWDFDNGNSASTPTVGQNVTETFVYRGTDPFTDDSSHYAVKLTTTNSKGCVKETTQDIYVYPKVEANFTFDYDLVCTPFDVEFTNSSVNGKQFHWDYGYTLGGVNQEYDSQRPELSHTYTFDNETDDNIQNYTIKLLAKTVYANHTCKDSATKDIIVHPRVITDIAPDPSTGCSEHRVTFANNSTGGVLNFNWIFGDGQSATSANRDDVIHTFINRGVVDSVRSVIVTATNVNGCSNSQIYNITTHPKVEAGFTFANQSLCTPFYLDLTNSGLNGNRFYWDFGYSGLDTITTNKNTFAYIFDNPTLNDILTYNIRLISEDNITGCSDTIIQPITVFPRVVSKFDVDQVIGCNPLPVQFTNQSSGLATYLWEFGDGTISVADDPGIIYKHANKNSFVDYTVSLTATNDNGCKSISDTVIRVNPLVQAMFQVNKINGCTPLTVNLSNSSTSPMYSYSWDWGDGRTDNAEQPTSITYTNSTQNQPVIQNRTMRLITTYTNDINCSDTIEIPIEVYPHIYPDFNVDLEGCHPHNVTFDNLTDSYNFANTSFAWDLGNSLNSYVAEPSLTYSNISKTNDTIYTVNLVATSQHGCTDNISKTITVHPRPVASMGVVGDYIACSPFNVQLDNQSLGSNLTYTYTFGDGSPDLVTTSIADVNHIFSNLNNTTLPYQIDLHIESQYGCDDDVSQTIYVYPEVTAQFAFNPGDAACNPFEITMVNGTQNGYLYEWDFDDGITSNLKNPLHRFINLTENDKTFNVHLKSISEFECFDEDEHLVTVYPQPVAAFSIDPPLKVFPDATFNFTNMTSPAADSWDYDWTFGDGYTADNTKNPGSHTYLNWGPKNKDYKYTVNLKVANTNCSDEISSDLTLLPAKPIPLFSADIYESCSPLVVQFINESEYGGPANGGSYLWDFDDGTTSTLDEPIHEFTNPGYYNVKLIVKGDGGESFYYLPFRVFQNPVADFAVFPQRVMLPDATVHLYNLTKYASRYKWEFIGDNFYEFSTAKDTVFTFSNIGEYRISLTAYAPDSLGGCSDFTTKFPAVWVEGVGKVRFPDAFVPNRNGSNGGVYDDIDYKNEVFHPVHYGVVEYKLMIFNRWGEQIFQSRDINVGWDGYFNGNLCEQGVYIWRAIGKFTNGKIFDMKGNVTLLR